MSLKSLEEKFKHELLGSHSVSKVKFVAEKIQTKRDLQALLNLIHTDNDYPTPEAAAWCIRHASFHLDPFHHFIASEIIKPLSSFDHRDSLIKNILGTLKIIDIPETSYGEVTNYCLTYLSQPTRSKAVLYYSMEIMIKICKKEPELTREFFMIVDDLVPLASPPFVRKYTQNKKKLSS